MMMQFKFKGVIGSCSKAAWFARQLQALAGLAHWVLQRYVWFTSTFSQAHGRFRLVGPTSAQPIHFFYLSARSPMCIRCARTSLAGQIHSFLSYLRSLASRPFLHRVSQAQRLVWATNHQQLASGEPGSAEIRQPIRP